MADRHFGVITGERGTESRRRVAMDEEMIGLELADHLCHSLEHGGDVAEVLIGPHDVGG